MWAHCRKCDEGLRNWQEEAECPYCGHEGLTKDQIQDHRIEDLEMKIEELEEKIGSQGADEPA